MTTTDMILDYNDGRDPALLALKWTKMRESAFAFFRGTAPLFFRTWAKLSPGSSPPAWICGDAHLENLGSYRGANRVPYFDLNDFDECCLAPVDWEIGRALAALHVLGKPLLARLLVSTYALTLEGGKPGHIEPEVAEGPIARLLDNVQRRSRKDFLAKWTARGRLRLRPGHSYALDRAAKAAARRKFETWARRQPEAGSYRVMDLCGRIAGNGSLGLERYIILVKGRRLPLILDMKAAAPAAPRAFLRVRQPQWPSEAERVATVQHFMQYVPIARLSWIRTAPVSYIVHALQPADDRIVVDRLSAADYEEFIRQWARLMASAHLRSAGWKGSANLDALMGYGRSLGPSARRRLLAAARAAASAQFRAWKEFRGSGLGKVPAVRP
ncbi:MAG TPA: DUF2252 family protein [Opitutaceae bacterium]|nr:DUF2252 family protein [Opitutaceae bacterium]